MTDRLLPMLTIGLICSSLLASTAEARGMRFGFGIGVGVGLAAGALAHRQPHDSNADQAARRRAEIHAEEKSVQRGVDRKTGGKPRAEVKGKSKPAKAPARSDVARSGPKPAHPSAQLAVLPAASLAPAPQPASSAAAAHHQHSAATAASTTPGNFIADRAGQPAAPVAAVAPGGCHKVVHAVGLAIAEPCGQ